MTKVITCGTGVGDRVPILIEDTEREAIESWEGVQILLSDDSHP